MSTRRWELCLDSPPRVLQIGLGVHGSRLVERFCLPGVWCVHLYRYRAVLEINGEAFPIAPGYASVTPPGADLIYRWNKRGPSVHAFAHFTLPPGHGVNMPAMQDLGSDFAPLNHAMEEAIGHYSTQPRRAEAILWPVLWRLADRAPLQPGGAQSHPAVEHARRLIELNLNRPIRVTDLAAVVGLSHNHLIRLFRAETSSTIISYIRNRRVQRAQHLLERTTLPVKAIAIEVGIPDLHLFNKTIRRSLGHPPRALRNAE